MSMDSHTLVINRVESGVTCYAMFTQAEAVKAKYCDQTIQAVGHCRWALAYLRISPVRSFALSSP